MRVRKAERVEVDFHCPNHLPDPDDLLGFVESKAFERAWKSCGLTDKDLLELQVIITCYPKMGPVIEGTGGVRKIRFAPTGKKAGKSRSHRALYVHYEEYGVVLLVTAYPKNKKDNISVAGKAAMKKMVEYQHAVLAKGPI